MRAFLNAILSFINSESFTDEEYEEIELETQDYSKTTYDALKALLTSREEISTQLDKLAYYFKAKGTDIAEEDAAYTPKSNIFIGGSLE